MSVSGSMISKGHHTVPNIVDIRHTVMPCQKNLLLRSMQWSLGHSAFSQNTAKRFFSPNFKINTPYHHDQPLIDVRPNKKISVFRVMGLKIFGRVGTHIFFFNYFFSGKKNNLMHFESHFSFQNA